MSVTIFSSRPRPESEDIVIEGRPSEIVSGNVPVAESKSDDPPPYYESAPPPDYENGSQQPQQPRSSIEETSLHEEKIWLKRYRLWLFALGMLAVIAIAITVGRMLSNRARSNNSSPPEIQDDDYNGSYDPTNIQNATVMGLASAECKQGTFLMWKTTTGEFWFTGQLLDGEWVAGDSGKLNRTKVPDDVDKFVNWAEAPKGAITMTAVCYMGSTADEVNFSVVYQHPNRNFKQITLQLRYLHHQKTKPSRPSAFDVVYETIEGVPAGGVSLASAYMTSPSSFEGHHLFYTIPKSSDNAAGGAQIIHRLNQVGTWGGPSSIDLNLEAWNAKSGIAAATIQGKDRNENKTSLHLVFLDQERKLVAVNWTESNTWSSPMTILTSTQASAVTYPFTFCIPSINHTLFQQTPSTITGKDFTSDSELYQQPFTTSTQYFVSWIASRDGSIEYIYPSFPDRYPGEPYRVERIWDPVMSTNCSSVRGPPLLTCSARRHVEPIPGSRDYDEFWRTAHNTGNTDVATHGDPDIILKNGDNQLILGVEGDRESRRWSERVQMFFVDGTESRGRGIRNMTWRRDQKRFSRWQGENGVLVKNLTEI